MLHEGAHDVELRRPGGESQSLLYLKGLTPEGGVNGGGSHCLLRGEGGGLTAYAGEGGGGLTAYAGEGGGGLTAYLGGWMGRVSLLTRVYIFIVATGQHSYMRICR